MLFTSIDFAIFLPIVFALYWFGTNHNLKLQNCLIVAASYLFYGWWDWRFLSLIFFSSVVDYAVGLGLARYERPGTRKALLWASIVINLGLLGLFKYYNFFLENFIAAFSLFGTDLKFSTMQIILPVGISFYTFQTMSYSIDVYRKEIEATPDFIAFMAYVSFFPQLVAGPIERAIHLLPQFYRRRTFVYHQAVDGLRQILWGLFKKIVIADNCAPYADLIFNNSVDYSGSTLVMGALFFTFQIYGDFSGYSDIAIGTARLFGFELTRNFAFPYFSRDIAEFWRRWHISLTSWFRSYLYIPLGGSSGGRWLTIRNTFIVFIISGFWHGANWTFIIWGLLNAIYFLPLLLTSSNRNHLNSVAAGRLLPSLKESLQMLGTFALTVFAWVFFRARNLEHAWQYICKIFSPSLFTVPAVVPASLLAIISVFILIEWLGREQQHALQQLGMGWPRPARWALYYGIMLALLFYYGENQQQFIYFQF